MYHKVNASVQLAVWRKRGRSSSDTSCRTSPSGSRPNQTTPPACPKPLGRYLTMACSDLLNRKISQKRQFLINAFLRKIYNQFYIIDFFMDIWGQSGNPVGKLILDCMNFLHTALVESKHI